MRPCGIPPVEIAKALKDRSKYKLISNGGSKSESITVGDEKRRLSRGERGDEAGMKLWKIAIKCHVSFIPVCPSLFLVSRKLIEYVGTHSCWSIPSSSPSPRSFTLSKRVN